MGKIKLQNVESKRKENYDKISKYNMIHIGIIYIILSLGIILIKVWMIY